MKLLPSRNNVFFVIGCCSVAVLGAAAGCAAKASSGAKTTESVGGVRPTKITHEACDTASKNATKTDVNGDKRPDIIHVMSSGREQCRAVDLNFDGTIDNYLYFDDKGELRRRESAFSTSGKTDEIAIYKNGKIAEKHRETNLDDKLDTWDFFENERLVRRERDTNADGKIDQVWTYADPSKPDCPLVVTDRDGDGKPELSQDVCKETEAAQSAQALSNAVPSSPASSGSAAPSASSGVPSSSASAAVPEKPAATTSSSAAPATSAAAPATKGK